VRIVRADDDPAEAVGDVDRDRDEVLDLRVGRGRALAADLRGILDADRLVALDHLRGEPLRDHAVLGVAVEADRAREVEIPVGVGVLSREKQPCSQPLDATLHVL